MNLQTKIQLSPRSQNLMDYDARIGLVGSCFVENIGAKLNYYKFKTLLNPFGILFNPIAIENFLCRSVEKRFYGETDVFPYNGQWICSDAHSRLNKGNKDELVEDLNLKLAATHDFLKTATHLVITLGTAWVYKDFEKDQIVANCHKRPQKEFSKVLLSPDQILNSIKNVLNIIDQFNPSMTIIFTVSPVRHIKDGIVENNRSKAHLVTALHQGIEGRPNLHYFSSYEIMMDELRDYRFYDRDMIHPNPLAIDYIWEKFKNVWISASIFEVMSEIETIQKGMAHKPFNPNSDSHRKFLGNLENKKTELLSRFPHLQF